MDPDGDLDPLPETVVLDPGDRVEADCEGERQGDSHGQGAAVAANPAEGAARLGLSREAEGAVVGHRLQVGREVGGRSITLCRLGRQALPHHRIERGGDIETLLSQ